MDGAGGAGAGGGLRTESETRVILVPLCQPCHVQRLRPSSLYSPMFPLQGGLRIR